MRFDIESFKLDELMLDEGNYRFQRASDQNNCIEKIFIANKPYFKNLMTSLANDDLGEPLLVYRSPDGHSIVLDGNRRTAALKVIANPNMAPSPSVRSTALELRRTTKLDFEHIHAQVSDNKDLILKTVYERHASGQGKSRINWNALANAKFRYDQKYTDGQEWHDIALLMELESRNDEDVLFVYSEKYSHEVFRRIVRAAIQENIINKSIFSEKNMRINQSRKTEVNEALDLSRKFLKYMEDGHLNLSRGGDTYADKAKIDIYLKQFKTEPPASTPDGTESDAPEKNATSAGHPGPSRPTSPTQKDTPLETSGDQASADSDKTESVQLDKKQPAQLPKAPAVVALLNELGSYKLSSLYNSLTVVSLNQHPALMVVGAWAFFETISRNLGASEGTSFDSFLGSKVNEWFTERSQKNSIKSSLQFINTEGNCNKHCKIYATVNAAPLAVHFKVLEPLIVRTLEELLKIKKKG